MKCIFCGSEIEKGTGKTIFMKDGKVTNFCGMKCEKNLFKLNRVARETPWTAEYKAAKLVRLGLLKEEKEKKNKTEKKTEEKKETKKEAPKKTK
jgi:large subunit ribosomal protein L24e